ncbi:MAG: glycosyltransferase [Candidatus Levybacteria bacterium]|nr:glycosyltransferase [Candidatus Levybacteria bacterium]
MNTIKLSVVIVNYKVFDKIKICISSIQKHFHKISYEIIVVENDLKSNYSSELSLYKKVKYYRSDKNLGFGAGNNLGVKHAKGEFIFFLNPDTEIRYGNVFQILKRFNIASTGIIAPLLVTPEGSPYKKQGTLKLNLINAIFSLSFIYKYFPNNKIARNFWLFSWNKKDIREVDVVPGTAFIIKRSLFKLIHGFDEKFFLFFEENDICNRVKLKGLKIFIDPSLVVMHEWGKSTEQRSDTKKIFERSRKYYFKKYYGVIGLLVELFILRKSGIFTRQSFLVIISSFFLFVVALFLRTYRLEELMQFIPDQGWFYISAKNMIVDGVVPLVGPPTSHPWIHHGPLWTYALGIMLYLSNFEPTSPGYVIAVFGAVTVLLLYYVASNMYTKKIAFLSAFIFATSPLVVMNSRIPYHTSPIPFFVILLFYLVYLFVRGKSFVLPFIALILAILYNLEITTFVFQIAVFLVIIFGILKKKEWIRNVTLKNVCFSIAMYALPMIPFIVYDIGHGYRQTLGFLVWVMYRVIKFPFSMFSSQFSSRTSVSSTIPEFLTYYKQLIFVWSGFVSLLFLILSLISLGFYVLKKINLSVLLLTLFLAVSFVGLFIHRIPIEADTLLISPFLILSFVLLCSLIGEKLGLNKLIVFLVFAICILNVFFLISTNFYTVGNYGYRITLKQRMDAIDKIIELSNDEKYAIVGKGELSDFPVFLDPYRYLLWYRGEKTSYGKDVKIIQIWEQTRKISVTVIK